MNTSLLMAIHEAAHAVMATHLRIPYRHVTVIPSGNTLGHLMMRSPRYRGVRTERSTGERYFLSDDEVAVIRRQYWEKRLLVSVAAQAAVKLVSPNYPYLEEFAIDDEQALSIAKDLGIPDTDVQYRLDKFRQEAQKIVQLPHIYDAIGSVAFSLLKHKTLSPMQVRAEYRESKSFFDEVLNMSPVGIRLTNRLKLHSEVSGTN